MNNQQTTKDAQAKASELTHLLASRWRWMTFALCILCFITGLYFGNIIGQGKSILYIGSNITKYNNAAIGILTK